MLKRFIERVRTYFAQRRTIGILTKQLGDSASYTIFLRKELRKTTLELQRSEGAREVIQKYGNDTLEELRALRRFERYMRYLYNQPNSKQALFMHEVEKHLNDISIARKESK